MSLGRRKREQQELWVATSDLPESPGHPFYSKLNDLLAEASFDDYVEKLCAPYYADGRGRPGIPPGIYFRMLLIGYFEGLGSQRAIAWRCHDSRSLQSFLGFAITEATPDHSTLTVIRKRLPLAVHEELFTLVLAIADKKKLLKGKSVAVDSTYIEADAAMKSIVRRDNGDDWKEYLKKLMAEEGIEDPSDEDIRKFDQKRRNKKVSNKEWMSPTDPDARIAKMKDGRTHMAYKTEHAIDLESDLVMAAGVYRADESDTATLSNTLIQAQAHTLLAGSEAQIKDAVADKGYHSTDNVVWCEEMGIRTYIPERESRWHRTWIDKPTSQKHAVYGNRRRVKGARGRRLGKLRSEYVERSFAHVCETGGARRSWLHGLENVTKRYLMYLAGKNLGVIMRALFRMGKPRTLQTEGEDGFSSFWALIAAIGHLFRSTGALLALRIGWTKFSVSQCLARPGDFIPRATPAAA
jgi:transposase